MEKGLECIGVGVIFFCHDGTGKFLMGLRSTKARDEQDKWDIGGGAIEWGDDVIETLKREVKEEYCCDVLEYEFLGYRDVKRTVNGKPSHWIALDYKVRIDPTQVKNGEPHKFNDVQWFTLATIPENAHSQFPAFLEKYGDRL